MALSVHRGEHFAERLEHVSAILPARDERVSVADLRGPTGRIGALAARLPRRVRELEERHGSHRVAQR